MDDADLQRREMCDGKNSASGCAMCGPRCRSIAWAMLAVDTDLEVFGVDGIRR